MSKFHEAADLLKREGNRYKSLHDAAKVLDEMGDLDQVVIEAKRQADAYRAETAQIKAEMYALKLEAEKAKAAHVAKLQANEAIASAILKNADDAAQLTVDMALAKAEKIMSDALVKGNSSLNAVKQQIEKLSTERDTLNGEIASLKGFAVDANAEADAAEKRLASVKAAISKLATA